VAKTELKTLFYSPIAWFLMIVFLIQCGVVYLSNLQNIARMQDLSSIYSFRGTQSLTNMVFLSQRGLFGTVMQNLYLFVPLLTMSLISRETSSGTIKLLYSSPVKVREIVFGKYLSMLVYNVVLVAIVGIFVVSGFYHIQHPEVGMLMTSLLGFYLLLCAYAAIGLFMSSLTTYQVVAAICTFVMIGILSYIGTLWQDIAFVRELTYFLSMNGRTGKLLTGLITTKDLIYFGVIVYIFLGLSIYKLRAGMESKPAVVKAGRYVAIVASALLIGYVSSIPSLIGYYDATDNKTRTITPQVQKVLADLGNEPLEVTAYNNLLGSYWYLGNAESYNTNLARWEPYIRFKNNIQLRTVCYYDSALDNQYMGRTKVKNLKELAEQYSKTMNVKLDKNILTPEQIHKIIDLRPEFNRYVMQLKWKGRTTFLRVFDDSQQWPGETEIAAALKRLQQAKLPKVAFLTGELERDIDKMGDRDYKAISTLTKFRYSLVNQGFDVVTVSLDTEDVPADIATLVIADPKVKFSAATMTRLQQYINKGGNLLIAGEPGKQDLLNPLLQPMGVQLMPGTIVQESKEMAPNLATPEVTAAAAAFSKPLKRNITDSLKVTMPGAAGLTFTANGAFIIQPLLMTDAKLSWNRIKPLDLDMATSASAGTSQGIVVGAAMPMVTTAVVATSGEAQAKNALASQTGTVTFSAQDGDVRGPIPTAVSCTRKINGREQRIIITGDADFMSNVELNRFNMRTANFAFNTALFSWLSYGEFPIDASRPDAQDVKGNITTDQVDGLRIIYVWILPALLAAAGAVLLIRRKRK
jgi:ABC-2 type transport system permease protein